MVAVLGLALSALTVAAAFVAIDRAPSSPVSDDLVVDPVIVNPVVAESQLATAASLRLEWTDERSLLWPGAVGTVTAIYVDPGEWLRSGDMVASIDRVGVVALATAAPLHRDLGPGSRGSDVADLGDALVDLGLLESADSSGVYGPATSSAMRALNETRGVSSDRLSVLHVLWLSEPFEVGKPAMTVGARAPSVGGEVFLSARHIASARVVASGADLSNAGRPLSFGDDLDREVVVGGSVFEIDADGFVAAPEMLESVAETNAETIDQVVVRLTEPLTRTRVPASAIVIDASGVACVLTPQGQAVPVEVLEGSAGSAFVSGVPEGPIVANPARSGLASSCG